MARTKTTVMSSLQEKRGNTVINKNLQKRKKSSVRKNAQIANLVSLSTSGANLVSPSTSGANLVSPSTSVKRDRTKEYENTKIKDYIAKVYKFAAKYNVSAAIIIKRPGSSVLTVAGVGFALGKIKKRKQIYKLDFIPPTQKGTYIPNIGVCRNMEFSEVIKPTIVHPTKKGGKVKNSNDQTPEVEDKDEVIDVDDDVEEDKNGEEEKITRSNKSEDNNESGLEDDNESGTEEDKEARTEEDKEARTEEDKEAGTEEREAGTGADNLANSEGKMSKDKDDEKGLMAGQNSASTSNDKVEQMKSAIAEAMDASCNSQTVGLSDARKTKLSLGKGKKGQEKKEKKKKSTFQTKMPQPGSVLHQKSKNFQPPFASSHKI